MISMTELKLVFPHAGKFAFVIVASVGAGKQDAGWGLDSKIEFGGQFKMNQLTRVVVAKKEVDFANGGMNVLLNLKALFDKGVCSTVLEENCQCIFIEMAQFLGWVEIRELVWDA